MSRQRTRPSAPAKSASRSGSPNRRPTPPPQNAKPRTAVVAGAALLVGAGGALGINALVQGGDDDVEQAIAERDVETTRELTEIARGIAEDLGPAVEGLAAAIPPQESTPPGPLASAEDVAAWASSVDDALAAFGDPPSAGTAVNVARTSLTASVEQFQAAVAVYEAALDADGEQQQRLIEIAGQQRSTAVFTWSVAATQIDFINVEANLGHAHVLLPSTPGSGHFLDGSPEGSH